MKDDLLLGDTPKPANGAISVCMGGHAAGRLWKTFDLASISKGRR